PAPASPAPADRAEARDLRIVVDVPDGEVVTLDRQALLMIVRNLLRNAIEHAAPATLRIGGDRHALVFSDNGPGIDPGRLARLFQRPEAERRADAGAARSGRVRGLGLA